MSAITAKASRKMKKYAVLTREPRCFLGSFDFSWEQRKVSDLAEKTYGGGTPTTSNEAYWNGDIPWIQSSDVVDGKLLGVEPRKWITQDGLNNSAAQLIPGNSIAIITRVGVGKLAFMPYSYATSQDFLSLSKLNAEPLFTVYACYKKLQSELNAVQGTSIKGITKDELLAKNIMVPRYAEQQQIGAFFKQLDNLITLHQRKCANLCSPSQVVFSLLFATSTFSWEQRKFEEIAVRSSVICSDDTLPRVEYEDIVSGTGRLNKDIYAKQSIKSGIAFHQGDVLYGKLRPYLQNWLLPTFDGLAVGDFWVLQPQNADSSFLYRLIQSRQFDEVANQSTGTKMPRADWKLVSKTVFSIPSNISEQAAIGTYFTALDSLITLHQRECISFTGRADRLILTANKKRTTSSWEQRKLGDIADIVGGGTPSTGNQSYWDGDIDWYAPAEIADQIYANSSQKKITGLGYENSSAKMLPPGTVLFTSRAGIGKTAILTRKGCTNQGFQSIVPHRGELDSYFIFSRTEELKRYGELVGAGSTFVEVSGKQMAVMELMMPPTMREQQTIGGFFQQLDHLITLHQRKPFLMKWRTSDANRNQTNRLVL